MLTRFGKRFGGDGPSEFRYPTQIVAAGGEIVVLDSGNYRIQILGVHGNFLRQFRVADVSNSSGLAMDNDGNIYVTDPQLNRLQVFSHTGQFLYPFGEAGTGVGQFNGMAGIWVDSGHCLYIVDNGNKRVQLFQIVGANARVLMDASALFASVEKIARLSNGRFGVKMSGAARKLATEERKAESPRARKCRPAGRPVLEVPCTFWTQLSLHRSAKTSQFHPLAPTVLSVIPIRVYFFNFSRQVLLSDPGEADTPRCAEFTMAAPRNQNSNAITHASENTL